MLILVKTKAKFDFSDYLNFNTLLAITKDYKSYKFFGV